MSDPKPQRQKPDELELQTETIRDLEPREQEEDEIRGGDICFTGPGANSYCLKSGVGN